MTTSRELSKFLRAHPWSGPYVIVAVTVLIVLELLQTFRIVP